MQTASLSETFLDLSDIAELNASGLGPDSEAARRRRGVVSVSSQNRFKREAPKSRPSMSRRNIKPTTFHDDSRSSDAGSVVTAPPRPKPRTIKDPTKDFPPLRDSRAVDPHPNGVQSSNAKLPPLGPDGEIQVCSFDVLCGSF